MAEPFRWRDGADVIARSVPRGEVPGFWQKQVIINPGEVAVLLKGGRIEDTLTQTKVAVQKGIIFKDKPVDELLFIDTTPFDIEVPLEATTKDYVKVNGTLGLRFQLSQTQAPKILGLIKAQSVWGQKVRDGSMKGKVVVEAGPQQFVKSVFSRSPNIAEVLTRDLLSARIASELAGSAINPMIAQYDAAALHGNVDAIRQLETAVDVEMRKTFEIWGLNLVKLWTNWEDAYGQFMAYRKQMELATGTEVAKIQQQRAIFLEQQALERERSLAGAKIEAEKQRMQMDLQAERERTVRAAEIEMDEKELDMAMRAQAQMHQRKMEQERLRAEVEKERIGAEKAKYEMGTFREGMAEMGKTQSEALEKAARVTAAANMPRTLVTGKDAGFGLLDNASGTPCPSCGKPVAAGAKFCSECGSKLGS